MIARQMTPFLFNYSLSCIRLLVYNQGRQHRGGTFLRNKKKKEKKRKLRKSFKVETIKELF